MKKLQILGTGCPTCARLAELTEYAAKALHLEYELEKVTKIEEILRFDIAGTPALVVDGQVKVSGRLPSVNELKQMLV
ncbi:MAG: thioredoxin family protein [Candidatus Hydrogenedentes bacterium]|nr:thioredoxin family protein [Candidatus Hydrogenedentota bacterium]